MGVNGKAGVYALRDLLLEAAGVQLGVAQELFHLPVAGQVDDRRRRLGCDVASDLLGGRTHVEPLPWRGQQREADGNAAISRLRRSLTHSGPAENPLPTDICGQPRSPETWAIARSHKLTPATL